MQKNVLNFIIAVAVLGLVIGISRDYFFKDKTEEIPRNTQTQIPTLIPSKNPETQLTICKNNYFNFKKGTTWKYELKSNNSTQYFTTTIIQANPTYIVVETKFDDKQKSSTSKIQCKKDGLYGLPFPIFNFSSSDSLTPTKQASQINSLTSFLKFDTDVRFLPTSDVLTRNNSWTTKIPLKLSLPINLPIDITINNSVKNVMKRQILNQGTKNTISISSEFDPKSLGQLGGVMGMGGVKNTKEDNTKMKLLDYTLAENIGITNMEAHLDFENSANTSMEITLIEFKELNK